jgi:uncharacterized protein
VRQRRDPGSSPKSVVPGPDPDYREDQADDALAAVAQKGTVVSEQSQSQSSQEPATAPQGPQFPPPPSQESTSPSDQPESGQQQNLPQYGQPQYGQPLPAAGAPVAGYSQALSVADQRMWAMLSHISGLVTSLIGLSFLGPLVVYLLFKDRGDYVRQQSAEALNFQILINVVVLATGIVSVVTLGLALLIVIPLWIILGIAALVLMIIAAVKTNAGEEYRYPVNWRLVR